MKKFLSNVVLPICLIIGLAVAVMCCKQAYQQQVQPRWHDWAYCITKGSNPPN